MRAIQKQSTGVAELVQLDPPVCGPHDLILRPLYSGICATDLHILYHDLGQENQEDRSVVLGHEFSAVVSQIGRAVEHYSGTSRKVKAGDRVTVEPLIPCRTCRVCLEGRPNLCPHMTHLGLSHDGCFADLVSVPWMQVHPLPEFVTDRAGALVEPLACAINFVDKSRLKPGESVVILGGGAIGQMTLQVALAAGAGTAILSDPVASKRELAIKSGAHAIIDPVHENAIEKVMMLTGGHGADVVIECVGVPGTVTQMLHMVKRGGRVVMAGFPSQPISQDFNPLLFGEVELAGVIASAWQFPRAMRMIELGLVDLEAVVDLELSFGQTVDGLARAFRSGEIGKVVIKHE